MELNQDVLGLIINEGLDLRTVLILMRDPRSYELLRTHLTSLEIPEKTPENLRSIKFLSQFPNLKEITGSYVISTDVEDAPIVDRWTTFSILAPVHVLAYIITLATPKSYLEGDRSFILPSGYVYRVQDGVLEVTGNLSKTPRIHLGFFNEQITGLKLNIDTLALPIVSSFLAGDKKLDYLEISSKTEVELSDMQIGMIAGLVEKTTPRTIVINSTYYTDIIQRIILAMLIIIGQSKITSIEHFIAPAVVGIAAAIFMALIVKTIGIQISKYTFEDAAVIAELNKAGVKIILFVPPELEEIRQQYYPQYEYRPIIDMTL